PILVATLERLEYRGYDSCGLAISNGRGIQVRKDVGTIKRLQPTLSDLHGTAGIGHTRWATVGPPSQHNAHPHTDCSGHIAVVHNGNLDNFQELKAALVAEGHAFRSETDSEVIAHLIEKHYHGDLLQALEQAVERMEGSYALVALHQKHRELGVARKESPLVIALGGDSALIASDAAALVPYCSRVMYLEDGDVGIVSSREVNIRRDGARRVVPVHQVEWQPQDVERSGYPHFMLKEIHEQPKVLRQCLGSLTGGNGARPSLGIVTDKHPSLMLLLGCGTSYHAALFCERLLEPIAAFPVRAQLASEFQPGQWVPPDTLAIALTQSGETADTLAALRWFAANGRRTAAVTNVEGSSATRIAQRTLLMRAGPEMSVAATKSFTAQLLLLYLLALESLPHAGDNSYEQTIPELRLLPDRVQQVLERSQHIKDAAFRYAGARACYVTGRGLNYPIALEGALKLKEVSYLPAEGYAAGELKHGPFALLDAASPVIALLSHDREYKRMLTTIREIKAREAPVVLIAPDDEIEARSWADAFLPVPVVSPQFSPLLYAVVLQLYAYYTALALERPIDRPRNLAKSVTVL
ncbi:MAG: glutamine--fructose-6-phosphate transaminase (isomerizing), partial [Chloroflexi bacterium]|nr:glutamine--fructose-6-phosphate transaminase (isomerizing) [Chloroflexota bacterium]